MITRKVDLNGRINLPSELCDMFNIQKDDVVEIDHNEEYILVRKFQPEYVCAITGKITDKGQKIGKVFISYEGLELISKKIDEIKEQKN